MLWGHRIVLSSLSLTTRLCSLSVGCRASPSPQLTAERCDPLRRDCHPQLDKTPVPFSGPPWAPAGRWLKSHWDARSAPSTFPAAVQERVCKEKLEEAQSSWQPRCASRCPFISHSHMWRNSGNPEFGRTPSLRQGQGLGVNVQPKHSTRRHPAVPCPTQLTGRWGKKKRCQDGFTSQHWLHTHRMNFPETAALPAS